MTEDWSFLARELYNSNYSELPGKGVLMQNRAIVGFAYRITATNVMSSLIRYESKRERDTSPAAPLYRHVGIISYHTKYKRGSNLTLSGQLAGKWAYDTLTDSVGTIKSSYTVQLVAGRMTYDLNDRWDVGFNDRDLVDSDYFNKRVYLCLRYKFDEKLFGAGSSPARTAAAALAPAVAAPPPPPPPVPDSDGDGVKTHSTSARTRPAALLWMRKVANWLTTTMAWSTRWTAAQTRPLATRWTRWAAA